MLGALCGMGLLSLSNKRRLRKHSSLVRRSPETVEYSHERIHQKKANVSRSATVADKFEASLSRWAF